jgi:Subtilase family
MNQSRAGRGREQIILEAFDRRQFWSRKTQLPLTPTNGVHSSYRATRKKRTRRTTAIEIFLDNLTAGTVEPLSRDSFFLIGRVAIGRFASKREGILQRVLPVFLALAFVPLGTPAAHATPPSPSSLRIVVEKHPNHASAGAPFFLPIVAPVIPAAGFNPLYDYASYGVFEGPAPAANGLLQALNATGFTAHLGVELDAIHLFEHDVDADTGLASPSYPVVPFQPAGEAGIYLVAFRAYPFPDWMSQLAQQGITILAALPPQSYIVRGNRASIESLPAAFAFVRGAFPMAPPMKTAPVDNAPPPPGVYRSVFVEVYEDSQIGSLKPTLDALDQFGNANQIEHFGSVVHYTASLTDHDIANLAYNEQVFAISSVTDGQPSSERQANIVAQPIFSAGKIQLPTTGNSYTGWLAGKCFPSPNCISDYSNTKVAILDTGFDNGFTGDAGSSTPIHPDFMDTLGHHFVVNSINGIPLRQTASTEPNVDDVSHGTVTTSVIAGFAPYTSRQENNYRYTLGLAPGVQTAVDKFFGRVYPGGCDQGCRLGQALAAITPWAPNLVNHSWNLGVPGMRADCTYDSLSQQLDSDTRINNRLHIVAAGNYTTDIATCSFVRSPATARNDIAVGATENFTPTTPGWQNKPGTTTYVQECNWNDTQTPSSNEDARNMPSFSATGRGAGFIIKPDLVAPAMRATGPMSRCVLTQYCGCTLPGGCNITSNGVFCNVSIDGTTYTGGGVQYGFSGGTSFAAPVVTGAAAIVRKWYRLLYASDPSPAMTKAILINGARDISGGTVHAAGCPPTCSGATIGHIPDVYQGWGMVSFDRLLLPASNYKRLDQTVVLTPNQSYQITGAVVDGTKPARITLVWTDPYKTTAGSTFQTTLVNNVDLHAAAILDCGFVGNVFSNGSSVICPTNYTPDAWNNVREIITPPGYWGTNTSVFIDITARNLMGDALNPASGTTPRQDFAIFMYNIR